MQGQTVSGCNFGFIASPGVEIACLYFDSLSEKGRALLISFNHIAALFLQLGGIQAVDQKTEVTSN